MVLLPLLCLTLVEATLRIVGFGHPSSFLLSRENNGRKFWIQNDRFGWRFFGPHYSRTPQAFAIARKKPADTIRIFVLGESAAQGDPQPDFGLPRMLQTMLSLRYTNTHFEVVNAAMTGINSHTIRDIAGSCARANGDIWVVYMGNNEVVGPFGVGTVFGPQTTPLPLIRAGLALRTTRTGQWLDEVKARLAPAPDSQSEWRGMMMFLNHRVRADDPRMKRVYAHLEHNLEDIIDTGLNSDARMVVCNVAVNLSDCAPFASSFRPDLDDASRKRWMNIYQQAITHQQEADSEEALRLYRDAGQIDNTVADLQFRMGQCLLTLGEHEGAAKAFASARDLDCLRFRFDGQMDEITREVSHRHQDEPIRFVDVQAAFEANTPNGIPGSEFFYEHVHLTWEGNLLLARTIASQLATFLPERVTQSATSNWADDEEIGRRLAWTARERLAGISEILARMQNPPFTHQLNHQEQVAALKTMVDHLSSPSTLTIALNSCEQAARLSPDDPTLQRRLASLRLETGNSEGAIEAAKRTTELQPHSPDAWNHLGTTLAKGGRADRAVESFETALRLDPSGYSTRHNLALAHAKMGQVDAALEEWERVLELKPRFGSAYLSMGQVLESQGQIQEAEENYRKALENRILRGPDLASLARLCLKQGWYEAAVTNLQDALTFLPTDASLHLELANTLTALGRGEEAQPHFLTAAKLNPTQLTSQFLLGLELGRQGKPEEAAAHFREVVRLDPELVEGRLNLAITLAEQGLNVEALAEFEEVLRRQPTNAVALQYASQLRAKPHARQAP